MEGFLQLGEQVIHLREDKNVVFEDEVSAQEFFLNNNYLHVISAAKIFFFEGIDERTQRTLYRCANFSEWVRYYQEDLALSHLVLLEILRVERMVNSRLAYYISDWLLMGRFTLKEEEIIYRFMAQTLQYKGIKQSREKPIEVWKTITKFTFGETVRLIKKIRIMKRHRQREDKNYQQLSIILDEITIFTTEQLYHLLGARNYCGHNIPIAQFLTDEKNENILKAKIEILFKMIESTKDLKQHKKMKDLSCFSLKYIKP